MRAFGDTLTKWGTPVLLIETGPWPDPNPDPPLVRVNFVALVRALTALADGSVNRANANRYDSLPENESFAFHYLIRNVSIRAGRRAAFTGDVGLSAARRIRLGRRQATPWSSRVQSADLGDLRIYCGVFEIDGTGKVLAPTPGAPHPPSARRCGSSVTGSIQVGSLANVMLLTPVGNGFASSACFQAEAIVQ